MYVPVCLSGPITRSLSRGAAAVAWRSSGRPVFLAPKSEFLHTADTALPEIPSSFLIPGYLGHPVFALKDANRQFQDGERR
jgi:hypothetical protein